MKYSLFIFLMIWTGIAQADFTITSTPSQDKIVAIEAKQSNQTSQELVQAWYDGMTNARINKANTTSDKSRGAIIRQHLRDNPGDKARLEAILGRALPQ